MKKKPAKLASEIERREHQNELAPFPPYDTEIINDLKIREKMITKKDDFNNVPVTYCKTCLSLHLKIVEFKKENGGVHEHKEVPYCVACSNTDLDSCHITEWEKLYEERYGETFLKTKNGKHKRKGNKD